MARQSLDVVFLLMLYYFCFIFNNGVQGSRITPKTTQMKSQNPPGDTSKNITKSFFSRSISTNLTNIHPAYSRGGVNELHASLEATASEYQYHGAMATMSVHGLNIESGQSSAAIIGLGAVDRNAPDGHTDVLQAGWHVRPDLYGDSQTHLFVSWTTDGFQSTGCFNRDCPGFVVRSDSPIRPGDVLTSLSMYNGAQQYITLSIQLDRLEGWQLRYGRDVQVETTVGHWPASLFSKLADGATSVEWGGVVEYPRGNLGPPMGSGHWYDEGYTRSASFSNLMVVKPRDDGVDGGDGFRKVDPAAIMEDISAPKCYSVTRGRTLDNGIQFYYGAPQGCPV